uniref:Integrase catalytic domain-containing protein n=1 Tax=Amphimedon queenslandica TaxID=400682 RepID=A0A1X7T8J4_AMPQE
LVKYIASRNEQLRIVKACHIDPTSGHLGIKKTYNRIAERFIWNAVLREVQNVVSSCDECQHVKAPIVTVKPRLDPVPVHSPWHHIGIDFIGPISPTSKSGNRYILTISDYFTKWASASQLPTKEACGVANTLLKLFMTMGLPKIITTDKGNEFKNANGLDERFNQTFQRMIAKYLSGKSKDAWDECIDLFLFAYNTSRHVSSLYSPFQVMFGRKAILPIDLQEGSTPSVAMNQDEIAEAIEVLTNNRIDIFENVKENIARAQNKQKKLYDMKHSNPCKFKIGASVLVKDFRKKKRRGGKLDGRWLGLFTIVEDCGKGFYRLKNRQKIIKRVNGAHLKIYKRPCNMSEDKLQVEVSDPPLPPPLMKVSTSASDDDLQPIRKRRKQIVQKKVIEIKLNTAPILSATLAESLKSENSEICNEHGAVFSNTSLISLNGIFSCTMVVIGSFIPPFFPGDVTCPVFPIKKQSVQISPVTEPLPNHHIVRPQPIKARVTEPVKAIAFKERQKKIEVTNGSAIKIDLVTEKPPEKGRRVHYSSKTWVKKTTNNGRQRFVTEGQMVE